MLPFPGSSGVGDSIKACRSLGSQARPISHLTCELAPFTLLVGSFSHVLPSNQVPSGWKFWFLQLQQGLGTTLYFEGVQLMLPDPLGAWEILPPSSVFGLVLGEGEGVRREGFGPASQGLILKLGEGLALVSLLVPPFLHLGGVSPGTPADTEGGWDWDLGCPRLFARVAFSTAERWLCDDLAQASPCHLPLVH